MYNSKNYHVGKYMTCGVSVKYVHINTFFGGLKLSPDATILIHLYLYY